MFYNELNKQEKIALDIHQRKNINIEVDTGRLGSW